MTYCNTLFAGEFMERFERAFFNKNKLLPLALFASVLKFSFPDKELQSILSSSSSSETFEFRRLFRRFVHYYVILFDVRLPGNGFVGYSRDVPTARL